MLPHVDALTNRLRLFFRGAWPIIQQGSTCTLSWHIAQTYCRIGARLLRGDVRNVAIAVPPGSAKNLFFNVILPVFSWTIDPTLRWLFASFDDSLEVRDGRMREALLSSEWFRARWPDVQIKQPFSALDAWSTAGGWFAGVTIGGKATGRHADFKVTNDPHKASEFASPARLASVVNWHGETLGSRNRDVHTVRDIVIHQRGNEADLIGSIIARPNQGGYEYVRLPARCEADNPCPGHDLRTRDGQTLWDRLPEKELQQIEKTIGSFAFAGQYMQRPAPLAGGIIKRKDIRHYEVTPDLRECDQVILSADLAFTGKATSDFSVIQCWARKGGTIFLIDEVRARLEFPEMIRAIQGLSDRYRPHVIVIEGKASGSAVVDTLRREFTNVVTYDPRDSKEARLASVSPLFESGAVLVPSKKIAAWIDEWIEEVTTFPGARFDDRVDACSQALIRLGDTNGDYLSKLATISQAMEGGLAPVWGRSLMHTFSAMRNRN